MAAPSWVPKWVGLRTIACAIAIMIAAVAILASGSQTAAAKKRKKTVSCTIHLLTQSFPTASAPGEDFGFVDCSGPFGSGVQHDTFTLTPETATTGTAELKFKAYFDDGTVSGVWRADYEFTSGTEGTFVQKVFWTRGTGAFKHVRGTGSGVGQQSGNRGTITQSVTVTGL
jgi:hypothetical protein